MEKKINFPHQYIKIQNHCEASYYYLDVYGVVEPERGFLNKSAGTVGTLIVLLRRADQMDRLQVVD